ncbi:hypothetical protein GW17_00030134 [Ensete ventricosum]|nr:hypothetical protein GW17_00030134 [Ensete ventricosum]
MHWSSANLASAKFAGLINVIRNDISILTLLAEVLSLLDMIVNSFAQIVSTESVDRYTRPEFTGNCLVLHATPSSILRCVVSPGIENVPPGIGHLPPGIEHVRVLTDTRRYSQYPGIEPMLPAALVLLCDRSGKSTYLQQVCLIIILAQIGCYVPARFASLRVVDRIFTRIGTGDNVENNSSTFMTEMKETAFLMQNVSPKSLIVMDELGRATSSSDGFAIAWSCCEHLLSLKA